MEHAETYGVNRSNQRAKQTTHKTTTKSAEITKKGFELWT